MRVGITSVTVLLSVISQINTIQVDVEEGRIEGKVISSDGKSIYNFLGVPFAEPPLNDRRFRKPIPLQKKFDGIYNATEIKPQCVSPFNTSALISEDCLHLNLWTKSVDSNAKLPVMFWIYGGSFFMGSATKQVDGYNIFDGTQLALRDVVVVTANYRLGVFGFLFGDSEEAPGNVGLWDQVRALEWVGLNIRQFGGNPNDITLFGVSAGSISISAHIISPISRSLFAKGIMQSGSAYTYVENTGRALDSSKGFAANQYYFQDETCEGSDWIQCLRGKTTEELNGAQYLAFYENFLALTPFTVVIGDQLLPKSCSHAFKNSEFKTDVQLLMGHSLMEGVSFARDIDEAIGLGGRYDPNVLAAVTKEQIQRDIQLFANGSKFGKVAEEISRTYTDGFPSQSNDIQVSKGLIRSSAHAVGDIAITCPTVIFGSELSKQSSFRGSVFQYRLTYANSKSISYGSQWAEAEHTDEQPLVFGRPLNELNNNWTAEDKKISEVIIKVWTDFAKYGKPSLLGGKEWPKYELRYEGKVNASYVELNPAIENSQRIHVNSYRGSDGMTPSVINNCLDFWFDKFSDHHSFARTLQQNNKMITASVLGIMYGAGYA